MSQDDVAWQEGAKGTKLACHKIKCRRERGAEGSKLACCKARGCRRQHKACILQGDVARHVDAEGDTKLACRKAMWLGTGVPKATQSLHVARRCG
ncbi:hypothetical protein L3X38_032779 [Prunus dulcis]|uniref:Uncharacterized protein n=1 Tax=Prunus dulcis TaxID=3755 RepID=A0AAD4YVA0_PRUDU|nr:hypothetical protein L3X38_032779 [Prunus dulcis]